MYWKDGKNHRQDVKINRWLINIKKKKIKVENKKSLVMFIVIEMWHG